MIRLLPNALLAVMFGISGALEQETITLMVNRIVPNCSCGIFARTVLTTYTQKKSQVAETTLADELYGTEVSVVPGCVVCCRALTAV